MRLSGYHTSVPCATRPGHTLLFSTKTTALTLLVDDVFARIRDHDIPVDLAGPLADLGLAVDGPDREELEVFRFYEDINRYSTKITVAQVLGMECNFSCRYCYEGTLKGRKAMDDPTADQLVAYLKERLTGPKKDLRFDFYGGEPLLYRDRIKYLAARLKPHVESLGGVFSFNLVTNGSLLTGKVCEELQPLGLEYAKVTIDGPAANHNYFRPFKGGNGSFDVIVKNLKEACQVVEIGLGANYTEDNYKDYPALLDCLTEQGVGPDRLERVLFNIVMKITDEFSQPEFTGGCASVNEPWVVDASLFLRQEAMRRGFYVPQIRPEVCMICAEDGLAIGHNGDIYKCLPLVGREGFKVGDVWQGVGDYGKTHFLDHWRKEEKCRKCVYLPMCYGGCRYMEYQRSGSMAKVDCQKGYFDAALEKMILQEVKYRC